MQYMLLIYTDEKHMMNMSEADMKAMYTDYNAFSKKLVDSGAMRGGSELSRATTATTVRVRNGKPQTLDGPYAETKEQLGGYYLIDVPNLDDAISWAAQIPGAAHGVIEVRPQPAMNH
jgi:hypothetical protein